MINPNKKSIRIYGNGGTGVNILSALMRELKKHDHLAEVNPVYVDSSFSNSAADPELTYIVKDMDGAGKDRNEMLKPARREAPNILIKHPAEEINIMVCSGGGATGAVVSTALAERIWEEGGTVVFFVAGSSESLKTAENSLKNFQTLNQVGQRAGRCPVICYDSNGDNTRRDLVDEGMIKGLMALLDLYSGNHEELDSADVAMWLRPEKAAKLEPQVVLLDIYPSRKDAESREYPISVAILHSSDDRSSGAIPADYVTEGYRRDDMGQSLFFCIHTEGLKPITDELSGAIRDFNRRAASRSSLNKVMDNINVGDDEDWG